MADKGAWPDTCSLQKVVMRFKPLVAPIKVGVYPLQGKDEFTPYVKRVTSMLTAAGTLQHRESNQHLTITVACLQQDLCRRILFDKHLTTSATCAGL